MIESQIENQVIELEEFDNFSKYDSMQEDLDFKSLG